ncbi:AEC family transporter [Psychromicrobium lacuslunae]|uniref:Permease n=1 Tax=Psychromicrobium lacuslunae TaxID=1618207 RepID=A0A0D4C0H9_9MICC|nr:AEC family transporter [Psychromicrobium lacuslunae]AJT42044.1 hypothetical protein UM93_11965 [Psychromicrobium lacuslunae]
MGGVLIGFSLVWLIIALGYLLGRFRVLGEGAQQVLSRFTFFVASPALLFETISRADFHTVFGASFWIVAASALVAALIFTLIWLLRRKPVDAELAVGAMTASYANANNLGLPIAVYVLGNAALAAPVVVFQLAIYQPLFVILIEVLRLRKSAPIGKILLGVIRNPLLLAALAGVLVAVSGWKPAALLFQPFELVGGAAVPCALIAFGISLFGAKPLADPAGRMTVLSATGIKLIIQPLAAYLLARFAFQLDGVALFAAVVLAGLPTAQNVYVIAARYRVGINQAKDAVLLSTAIAVPAMLIMAALLT